MVKLSINTRVYRKLPYSMYIRKFDIHCPIFAGIFGKVKTKVYATQITVLETERKNVCTVEGLYMFLLRFFLYTY